MHGDDEAVTWLVIDGIDRGDRSDCVEVNANITFLAGAVVIAIPMGPWCAGDADF